MYFGRKFKEENYLGFDIILLMNRIYKRLQLFIHLLLLSYQIKQV